MTQAKETDFALYTRLSSRSGKCSSKHSRLFLRNLIDG
jgi:hypothetical protein